MTDQPDSQELRTKFAALGMPGMVALIDHLLDMEKAGTHVTSVGSSTIDLHNLMECKNMSEKDVFETVFFRLNKLHFGSKLRTPLQDISDSFVALEKAPEEARKRIDEIVGQFARVGAMAEKILRHTQWHGNEPTGFEEVDPMAADDDCVEVTPEGLARRWKLN